MLEEVKLVCRHLGSPLTTCNTSTQSCNFIAYQKLFECMTDFLSDLGAFFLSQKENCFCIQQKELHERQRNLACRRDYCESIILLFIYQLHSTHFQNNTDIALLCLTIFFKNIFLLFIRKSGRRMGTSEEEKQIFWKCLQKIFLSQYVFFKVKRNRGTL